MSTEHNGGNILNAITYEEHEGLLNAKRVSMVSSATIYAVVNTASAGQASVVVDGPVSIKGNLTLSDSKGYIGLVSVSQSAWTDPKTYIGLTSVQGSVNLNSGINNIGFATVAISNPTLYAVVNTGAAGGQASVVLDSSSNYIGLTTTTIGSAPTIFAVVNTAAAAQASVVLDSGTNYIGFATVTPSTTSRSIVGNITLTDPKTYIGLTSVSGTVGLAAGVAGIGFSTVNVAGIAAGANYIGLATTINASSTANIGSVSVLGGGIGLNAGVNAVGFATVYNATAWPNPNTFIGLVTVAPHALSAGAAFVGIVTIANTVALKAGAANVGCVTLLNQPALTASAANIGCVTLLNQPALTASAAFIGIVTVTNQPPLVASAANIGCVTVLGGSVGLAAGVNGIGFSTVAVGAGTQFIGLVTANAVNIGTNKALVNIPIGFQAASITTIAVPTNANTIKITNILLTSDATVSIRFKSGITYLTGNASIGVTLLPGAGFVQTGSPDSPSWIGLPSGSFVIEKLDQTATSAKLAGNVIYFQE